LLLPEIGEVGQAKLRSGNVLVVGAGGLGSPAALYLAAAGVGTLGILDADVVDLTNLQRQIIHSTDGVGRRKAESALERLGSLNPHVNVVAIDKRLTSGNALEVLQPFDVIVDATDNFATRYLVNDACILLGKPCVYASVLRFEGQATVFGLPGEPCYRCLFPSPPPAGSVSSCSEAGVLGVLPGLLGVIQATEALKLLLGIGESLAGRLLLVDALRMKFQTISIPKDPACIACGTRTLTHLEDYDSWCGARRFPPTVVRQMMPAALHELLSTGANVDVIDVREPWEWGVARIEGARLIPLGTFEDLVGTLDPERDLVLYCHHGVRSQSAADRLVNAGYTRVFNLSGGIERWRLEVDPSMRGY
jgi:adenylyltransferase/sulfurtransferase